MMPTPRSPSLAPDPHAKLVARIVLEGFDKHYRIFRESCRAARECFEQGDWRGVAKLQTERIGFYDNRVRECVDRLWAEVPPQALEDRAWEQVKLHFVALLIEHEQPECAETFFNSVSTRILKRSYYQNRFLFVRPMIATEYLDCDPPSYRVYYPVRDGLRRTLRAIITDFELRTPFAALERDLRRLLHVLRLMMPRPLVLEPNHQIQVLSSLFFRGNAAFVVGKVINGDVENPFAVPIMLGGHGKLIIDAVLLDPKDLAILFSAKRAYFMVEMNAPATYVEFLQGLMPRKPKWELYTMLGLQKAGKNYFFRDFLHHLKHSSDELILAPGTKGLVMVVFTARSYPYVFKVIRDHPEPPKEVDRQTVRAKYRLVKHHDRAGRMADTLEFSDVPFPKSRFTPELLAELKKAVPSQLDIVGETVFVKHLYIERRMVPLDLYLRTASDEELDHAMAEYGDTLRELAETDIFPGDLLFKNFGVTRFGRVVFYDYDEIDAITACNFRDLPQSRYDDEELSAEPWFAVGPKDIFPEEFERFLLTNPRVREAFMRHNADLLDPRWWRGIQQRLREDAVGYPLAYPARLRFASLFAPGSHRFRTPAGTAHRRTTPDAFAGVIPD